MGTEKGRPRLWQSRTGRRTVVHRLWAQGIAGDGSASLHSGPLARKGGRHPSIDGGKVAPSVRGRLDGQQLDPAEADMGRIWCLCDSSGYHEVAHSTGLIPNQMTYPPPLLPPTHPLDHRLDLPPPPPPAVPSAARATAPPGESPPLRLGTRCFGCGRRFGVGVAVNAPLAVCCAPKGQLTPAEHEWHVHPQNAAFAPLPPPSHCHHSDPHPPKSGQMLWQRALV